MAHTTTDNMPSAPEPVQDNRIPLPGFARRVPFGIMLVATGVVGWVAAGILILEKLELYRNPDHVPSCDLNPWMSCGQVMETWQSELFGFPNPFIGLVGFTIIITTGAALLAGAEFSRWYWTGLQVGVTLGSVFAIWLWSQALFDIYILCLYCMIAWAAMIPLFILTTLRNMNHRIIPAPSALTRWLADWVGPIIVLAYLALAGSVFFRFIHVFT